MLTLDKLKLLKEKADPEIDKNWGSNVPFYVDLKKPRPSLSKYDHKRDSYYHYDDGQYIAACVQYVDKLIEDMDK